MQKIKHELINPLPGKPPRYDNVIIMVGEDQAKMPIAAALIARHYAGSYVAIAWLEGFVLAIHSVVAHMLAAKGVAALWACLASTLLLVGFKLGWGLGSA